MWEVSLTRSLAKIYKKHSISEIRFVADAEHDLAQAVIALTKATATTTRLGYKSAIKSRRTPAENLGSTIAHFRTMLEVAIIVVLCLLQPCIGYTWTVDLDERNNAKYPATLNDTFLFRITLNESDFRYNFNIFSFLKHGFPTRSLRECANNACKLHSTL